MELARDLHIGLHQCAHAFALDGTQQLWTRRAAPRSGSSQVSTQASCSRWCCVAFASMKQLTARRRQQPQAQLPRRVEDAWRIFSSCSRLLSRASVSNRAPMPRERSGTSGSGLPDRRHRSTRRCCRTEATTSCSSQMSAPSGERRTSMSCRFPQAISQLQCAMSWLGE